MTTIEPAITFDFRKTIEENRLKGLWKMMVDYRLPYLGATAALAARNGTTPHKVSLADIRRELTRHGAIVPGTA